MFKFDPPPIVPASTFSYLMAIRNMSPETIETWTARLRSGGYVQVEGALRRMVMTDPKPGDLTVPPPVTGYCCLGVLCTVYHDETGRGQWNGEAFIPEDGVTRSGVLPPQVSEWANTVRPRGASWIGDPAPVLVYDPMVVDEHGITFELSNLNDGGGTFARIADLIEGTYTLPVPDGHDYDPFRKPS